MAAVSIASSYSRTDATRTSASVLVTAYILISASKDNVRESRVIIGSIITLRNSL